MLSGNDDSPIKYESWDGSHNKQVINPWMDGSGMEQIHGSSVGAYNR